jgi:PhnB protein
MAEGQPVVPTGGATPYLTIRHQQGQAAVDFYRRAFGAEEVYRALAEDGVRLMHSHLLINGASVMLSDDFPEFHSLVDAPPPSGVTIHLEVDDADAWWARATAAGAEVKMPLDDQFWGARYGQLRDPFGHSWSIASPSRSQGGSQGGSNG